MTWIKLEDDFTENRKFLRVGPLAGYLAISAIAWSTHNLTDGKIPEPIAYRLVDTREADLTPADLIERLIAAGLWERDGTDYRIHDYLFYQRPSSETAKARAKLSRQRSEAGKRGAAARWQSERNNEISHVLPSGKTPTLAQDNGQPIANEWQDDDAKSREGREEKGEEATTTTIENASHSLVDLPDEIFQEWQERCHHPQAKLSPERRRKIEGRLKEGATREEFRTAIEGAAKAAHVSDSGQRFDDIELICRNRTKFESFIARTAAVPQTSERDRLKAKDTAVLKRIIGGTR